MADRIKAFTMPKWGIEMEEGVIREWRADEGAFVKEGEIFTVIETDKIANDVELEYSGILRKRIGQEGDAYKVGALIAVFADEDVPQSEVD
ncbi:MAG: biotin/lipoyl-containing protein, partial [Pseudomonadota bacterium]